MVKRTRWFLFLVCGVGLAACATVTTGLRRKVRTEFADGNFVQAEQGLIQPKIIADTKTRLLTLLNLGLIAHYEGKYEKSNFFLFQARHVAHELYTKSIKEGLESVLWNDNTESYAGMDYEISLAHYYSVLNFVFLSEETKVPAWRIPEIHNGKEVIFSQQDHPARTLTKREQAKFREQARSELIAWNDFLNQVRQRNVGEPYYKDDLLNKVFAAYVHRMMGTAHDRNIAEILLKNADQLMIKAYSAYPSFNKKWQQYVDHYSDFEAMGEKAVKAQFIDPTKNYKNTQQDIDHSPKKGNVFVLVESGEIPMKQAKNYVIGFSTLFNGIKDPALRAQIENIGAHVFLQMAPQFGLAFVGATIVGATTGNHPHYISQALDSALGFEFKLPTIKAKKIADQPYLHFHNAKEDKVIPLGLLEPLSDIARLNVNRRATAVALKTGLRVGAKYLAALIPAILTYRKMQSSSALFRWAATMGVWMAGKKIVDATEAPDLRSWDLLPAWIAGGSIKLPPGSYTVSLVERPSGSSKALGTILVTKKHEVHEARIFSGGKVVLN